MTIKVFELDEYEWWAGESLGACIAAARDKCGKECYPDAEIEGSEITEEQMNENFSDSQLTPRNYLDTLILNGTTFPCFFAGRDT